MKELLYIYICCGVLMFSAYDAPLIITYYLTLINEQLVHYSFYLTSSFHPVDFLLL